MSDNNTNKIIQELLVELKEKYSDFRGIYLFGSRARGDYNKDSDYDLAIIFDRKIDTKLKREISRIIACLMVKYQIIVDNPVMDMNDLIEPITPLRENIKNEGIFYEAA
jgi:uncharacterized protein